MMRIHLTILLLLISCSTYADWVVRDEHIMGTKIHVEVWSENEAIGIQAAQMAMDEMHIVNETMSPYIKTSELSRVNKFAALGTVTVGPALFELIQKAEYFSELTNGAFDITFASAGHLYNYREGEKPEQDTLSNVLDAINYRHIRLQEEGRDISFLKRGVKIDLGGIAKGHAVDQAIGRLEAMGIKHALVSAGGDTRILGDRKGRPWYIGIRDPSNKEKMIVKLPIINEALSTSGDYERYFEKDGVRYHHILNPRTGDSAREVKSVSVLGPVATDTDALSTSVFVMGVKEGLKLIESLQGYEAVIVDQHGNLHYSSGLQTPD